MIIGFDIGNTHTNLGCFHKNEITPFAKFSLTTASIKSSGELTAKINFLLNQQSIKLSSCQGIIISSVVPVVDGIFQDFCQELGLPCKSVHIGMKTGIDFKYDKPEELGADRIVNAAGAFKLYHKKSDMLIIDLGTATTFCVILASGVFQGGIIAPGLGISLEALYTKTAKLPKVMIERPDSVIGTSTASSIQSGIYYGFASMVQGLIEMVEKQLKRKFSIVLTGGFSSIISRELTRAHITDRDLTLKGLKILYDINSEDEIKLSKV
jgi:type III pantothenate kinase